MFAIGFVLFFVALLLDEVFDPFSNHHKIYALVGVLGVLLMVVAFAIWLFRVLP